MEAASAPPVEDTNAAATAMMGLFHLASASAADPEQPHAPADAGVRAKRMGGVTHGASECGPMRRLDGQAPESTTNGDLCMRVSCALMRGCVRRGAREFENTHGDVSGGAWRCIRRV